MISFGFRFRSAKVNVIFLGECPWRGGERKTGLITITLIMIYAKCIQAGMGLA